MNHATNSRRESMTLIMKLLTLIILSDFIRCCRLCRHPQRPPHSYHRVGLLLEWRDQEKILQELVSLQEEGFHQVCQESRWEGTFIFSDRYIPQYAAIFWSRQFSLIWRPLKAEFAGGLNIAVQWYHVNWIPNHSPLLFPQPSIFPHLTATSLSLYSSPRKSRPSLTASSSTATLFVCLPTPKCARWSWEPRSPTFSRSRSTVVTSLPRYVLVILENW